MIEKPIKVDHCDEGSASGGGCPFNIDGYYCTAAASPNGGAARVSDLYASKKEWDDPFPSGCPLRAGPVVVTAEAAEPDVVRDVLERVVGIRERLDKPPAEVVKTETHVEATEHGNLLQVTEEMARRLAEGWGCVGLAAEQGNERWSCVCWWARDERVVKKGPDGEQKSH